MNEIVVSEIQIVPTKPKDGLVAFATCVINNQFYYGNIAIYTSPSSLDGFRLVYPSKMLPTGKQIQCMHPVNREAGEAIHNAIIGKYKELMERLITK
jgi:DNA-binding cell septation regulator SpoVG